MIFDILYTVVFFICSISFADFILKKRVDRRYLKPLKFIIFLRFIMGVAFYLFTRNGGGDAWGYWTIAKEMSIDDFLYNIQNELGTRFIEALNFIPVHFLGLSFFANTMFYSMLGSFGITFFYAVTLHLIPSNPKLKGYFLFPLLFFTPNMHFWSAGVGKDAIVFMAIGMFLYGILIPFKRIVLIIIAMSLAFAIRPHVVLFIAFSFGLVYVFGNEMSNSKKIFISLIFVAGAVVALPTVMTFVKLEDVSASAIESRTANQAELLRRSSGSAIDVSSYPLPLKIFTFLFRPLFFDARSVNGLLASVENLILLVLTYKAFKFKPIATFKAAPTIVKALLVFLLIGSVLFSMTLGNLGIMIRMRNMFLPGLIIYLLWSFSYQYEYRKRFKIDKMKLLQHKKQSNYV